MSAHTALGVALAAMPMPSSNSVSLAGFENCRLRFGNTRAAADTAERSSGGSVDPGKWRENQGVSIGTLNLGQCHGPRLQQSGGTPSASLREREVVVGMKEIEKRLELLLSVQTKLEDSVPLPSKQKQESPEQDNFHVNCGSAIRSLRDELPALFYKELNYGIYRGGAGPCHLWRSYYSLAYFMAFPQLKEFPREGVPMRILVDFSHPDAGNHFAHTLRVGFFGRVHREDITFSDPMNTFAGIENYKTLFWALRFHGRIFFKALWVDIVRVYQPSDKTIMVRWIVRGIPRVPWEAQGRFEGTSEYRLDKDGKIYSHKVDNVIMNAPPKFQARSVMDLVRAAAAHGTPTPTYFQKVGLFFFLATPYLHQFSWVRFYLALRSTLAVTAANPRHPVPSVSLNP